MFGKKEKEKEKEIKGRGFLQELEDFQVDLLWEKQINSARVRVKLINALETEEEEFSGISHVISNLYQNFIFDSDEMKVLFNWLRSLDERRLNELGLTNSKNQVSSKEISPEEEDKIYDKVSAHILNKSGIRFFMEWVTKNSALTFKDFEKFVDVEVPLLTREEQREEALNFRR